MVDHKTPVLLLICLVAILVVSGCATTHSTGAKYVGDYKDGKYHGHGTLTYPSGQRYVGEWRNDKKNGQGTFTHPTGAKYVGDYKDGKYHGHGTYTFPSGEKYIGEFRDNKYHGHGTLTHPTGAKYVGDYKDGKYHGHGTLTYASGRVKEGIWKKGIFQSAQVKARAAAQAKARDARKAKKKAEAIRQAKANKEKLMSTRKLAERGDANAQYNLGVIYHKGLLGASQDDKEAVKWLMKAAIQGDNEAQDELAYISPAAVDEVIRIQTMNKAKVQCTELGLTLGTDKHADCAVQMFSTARADQRMEEQLKAKRAETDRLIRQSKLNQADSDRRNKEQVRLQRAALKAQKRQRDREVSLRMLRQGLEMMQGQPTPTPSAPVTCFTDSDGAGGLVTHCQ